MMKDCIDNALQKEISNTKFYSVGLLVEGRSVTLFASSLPSEGT
jgi:hypothetical protein